MQSEERAPSVVAAVFRDGEVVWRGAVGNAELARPEPATPAHAYRIGSITKTFTAVCILQLRDAGALALDDPLRAHVPEVPTGPTVADALSHLSGLQREPPGEVWESLEPPTREELIAGLEDAERVLMPGEAWHYSNLAFGLLGEVVARRGEQGYEHELRTRVLDPLGLEATAFDPPGPRATGYYVDPYSDGVTVEPDLPAEGPTAAMGWLWSTVDDLARWGDFLATGHEDVLARETLDEMARVRAMVDHVSWEVGWGLGLGLYRRGNRVYAGHGGAMPGFLSTLLVDRRERTGAVVLCEHERRRPARRARTRSGRGGARDARADAGTLARRRGRTAGGGADARPVVVGGLGARPPLERRAPRDRAAVRSCPGETSRGSRRRPRIAGASSRAGSSASSFASPATRRASPCGSTSRRTR